MSALRFQVRHLQQTIADHVESHLASLGWTADPPPWDIAPITFREVQPNEVADLSPTIVSTLVEREDQRQTRQLGGGVYTVEFRVIVDVYAEKLSIALSIASDIKDALEDRHIDFIDYTTATPAVVAGAYIEFENTEVTPGTSGGITTAPDVKKAWRSVGTWAMLTYTET